MSDSGTRPNCHAKMPPKSAAEKKREAARIRRLKPTVRSQPRRALTVPGPAVPPVAPATTPAALADADALWEESEGGDDEDFLTFEAPPSGPLFRSTIYVLVVNSGIRRRRSASCWI